MKNLLLFVSLLIAGASYTPPVNNAGEPGSSGNAYVYIDEDSIRKNYIRNESQTVAALPESLYIEDEQYSDTKALIESKYGVYKTNYLFSDQRSILAFDAPSLKSIDRLTIKIRFKIYAKVDFLNFFPKYLEETFLIKASNFFQPYSYYALHNEVSGADTKEDYVSNYTIPYIGEISDIVALEGNLGAATDLVGGSFSTMNSVAANFEHVIDNPAWLKNYYSVLSSNLADSQFYVILPCYFDIDRVLISVAGTDINDDPVLDGLDSSGVPFTTDIGGETYNYIDLNSTSVRSVYFSEVSTIRSIVVSGVDVGGHEEEPYIRFGDYDFTENDFNVLLNEFHLTDTGEYINSLQPAFTVLSGYDAVVSAVLLGDFNIRIFYTSQGIAVYQNIVDANGVENVFDDSTAPGDSGNWFTDTFISPFTGIISYLSLILRIVLVVSGVGLFIWAIVLISKSLNKSKKGGIKK